MALGPTMGRLSRKGPSQLKWKSNGSNRSGNGRVPRNPPPTWEKTAPGLAYGGARTIASVGSQAGLFLGAVAVSGTVSVASAAYKGAQDAVDNAGKEFGQWQKNPTEKASNVSKEAQKSAALITADIVGGATTAADKTAKTATSTMNSVRYNTERGVDTAASAIRVGASTAANAPGQAFGSFGSAASASAKEFKGFFEKLGEALGKIKNSLNERRGSTFGNSRKDNRDNLDAQLSSLHDRFSGTAAQTYSDKVVKERSEQVSNFWNRLSNLRSAYRS